MWRYGGWHEEACTGTGGCWADRGRAGTCKLLPTEFQGQASEKLYEYCTAAGTRTPYRTECTVFVTSSKNEYSGRRFAQAPPMSHNGLGLAVGGFVWNGWNGGHKSASQRRDAWPSTSTMGVPRGGGTGRQHARTGGKAGTVSGSRRSLSLCRYLHYIRDGSQKSRAQNPEPGQKATSTVLYRVDTCTSVAETPGFPKDSLVPKRASKKLFLIHACEPPRKHCHGWKLHPPKRAWYQLVVAPVWTARIPNNSAVPVMRYEVMAKLCGVPIAALH